MRLEVWLPLSICQTEFGACGGSWWERAHIRGRGEGTIDLDSFHCLRPSSGCLCLAVTEICALVQLSFTLPSVQNVPSHCYCILN